VIAIRERLRSYLLPAVTILVGWFLFSRADALLMSYFTGWVGREAAYAWSMLWIPALGELLIIVLVLVGAIIHITFDLLPGLVHETGAEGGSDGG